MKRSSIFVAGTLLVAGLVANAAQAHQWGCWIQADRNVRVRNAAGSIGTSAINDWNSMTILNISSVSSGEETYVFNANSGNTGWGGIARITNYSGCTILRATSQLNTYYSWTTNGARGVQCQEVGHTFGLDHSNDGGCMGGGYWYDISTHYRPVSHNVTDIGNMYANRVVGTSIVPEHPVVGPEADAPRIHAFWANNPRTIGETTRLASHIVIATATGVAAGKPIVAGNEPRIPTQRVSFDIERSHKGNMVDGESFVLFQNGNDHNRFDEDPSYKVGSTYLLFLTPRKDGTFLVVSPEGRYELVSHDDHATLIPASKKGFAADLKGASLQNVLSDVKRVVAETSEQ